MNLVTDGAPALALGVDPIHDDPMQQPPRNPKASVLSLPNLARLLLQGVILTLGTVAAYFIARRIAHGPNQDAVIRTIAGSALVVSQLFHAFNFRVGTRFYFSRAWLGNRWLLAALAGSLVLQAAVVYVPFLNPVFRTARLGFTEVGVVLLCALIPVLIINLVNRLTRAETSGGRSTANPRRA
jgi:Ca2+-transporting ATPase